MTWLAKLWSGAGTLLGRVPDVVWWILLVIAGAEFIDLRARWDEKAKAKAARQEQIASQRQEAAERVQAFNEASSAVEHLPELELRTRSETDPNNRGRVSRD